MPDPLYVLLVLSKYMLRITGITHDLRARAVVHSFEDVTTPIELIARRSSSAAMNASVGPGGIRPCWTVTCASPLHIATPLRRGSGLGSPSAGPSS